MHWVEDKTKNENHKPNNRRPNVDAKNHRVSDDRLPFHQNNQLPNACRYAMTETVL